MHLLARRLLTRMFAGLGPLACAGEEARVSVQYFEVAPLPRDLLTVTLADGASTRTLRGADIGTNGREGRVLSTRTAGTLRVGFRFAAGQTVASEGAVELPLRPDWHYGIAFHVDSLDPKRGCFGCQGSRAFPLAAAHRRGVRDSLWVVWGGNFIENPVIY